MENGLIFKDKQPVRLFGSTECFKNLRSKGETE
jgi:hypothetical protein